MAARGLKFRQEIVKGDMILFTLKSEEVPSQYDMVVGVVVATIVMMLRSIIPPRKMKVGWAGRRTFPPSVIQTTPDFRTG